MLFSIWPSLWTSESQTWSHCESYCPSWRKGKLSNDVHRWLTYSRTNNTLRTYILIHFVLCVNVRGSSVLMQIQRLWVQQTLGHILMLPWVSYITSLKLSVFICKRRTETRQVYWTTAHICEVSSTEQSQNKWWLLLMLVSLLLLPRGIASDHERQNCVC